MVYPTSGATGIPDGNFTLTLASAWGTAPLTLSATGAPTVTTSSPQGAQYAVPALRAATTYTVTGTYSSSATCPSTYTTTFGTFTTS
jgi:hypothetical protein